MLDPTRLTAESLRLLPRKRVSRALGSVAAQRVPQPALQAAIRGFVAAFQVDLSEAEVPAGGFTSFDAFFTRRLRAGARPLDPDPAVLLSPADGVLEDAGPIDAEGSLRIKGRPYTVRELLGAEGAASYAGGWYGLIYLSPRDYHRVHAPVGGPVRERRYLPGSLWPVNAIGVRHVPQLFARNERVAVVQDAPGFGAVTTLLVGAIVVGSIGLAFEAGRTNAGAGGTFHPEHRAYGDLGPELARGDELGVFHLGSTVVVFARPEAHLRARVSVGEAVRVGEALAVREGA
ncbi:MAG: archaetidylserine decarboxylase [Myxococcota bacterium]